MEKIIDLIEDRIIDLKHEIKPLLKGNSSYEEKAEQIRYLNTLLREVRAMAKSPLNESVQPISDVVKSVCEHDCEHISQGIHRPVYCSNCGEEL